MKTLKQEDLTLIEQYLKETENKDAPGHYIQWLHKKKSLTAYKTFTHWFDIANARELLEANKTFMDKGLTTEHNVKLIKSKIQGKTHIHENCHIEHSTIENCIIFNDSTIKNCHLKNCIIDKNSQLSNLNLSNSTIGASSQLTND